MQTSESRHATPKLAVEDKRARRRKEIRDAEAPDQRLCWDIASAMSRLNAPSARLWASAMAS